MQIFIHLLHMNLDKDQFQQRQQLPHLPYQSYCQLIWAEYLEGKRAIFLLSRNLQFDLNPFVTGKGLEWLKGTEKTLVSATGGA